MSSPSFVVEDPLVTVAGWGRALRRRGVSIGPDRVAETVAAIATVGPTDLQAVYWAGRASLVSEPTHIALFDEVFASWERRRTDPEPRPRPADTLSTARVAGGRIPDARQDDEPGVAGGSRLERLGRRDVTSLSDAETAEILELVAALHLRPDRRGRRTRPGGHGRIDVDRTVETMLRSGGEITGITRSRVRPRPRRLVVLVDVSASMERYAEHLLRFAYAAVRAAPRTTEVFTLGTRLTRLTRHLRYRVPARALDAVGTVVVDWHGGTRLERGIGAFLDGWGRRGTARGAVVVICSDGQTTDVEGLRAEVERLARFAHTVIWANPRLDRPRYRPVDPGLRAVRPFVDRFVAAGSLDALRRLAVLVSRSRLADH